jgi:hypothetical protein
LLCLKRASGGFVSISGASGAPFTLAPDSVHSPIVHLVPVTLTRANRGGIELGKRWNTTTVVTIDASAKSVDGMITDAITMGEFGGHGLGSVFFVCFRVHLYII